MANLLNFVTCVGQITDLGGKFAQYCARQCATELSQVLCCNSRLPNTLYRPAGLRIADIYLVRLAQEYPDTELTKMNMKLFAVKDLNNTSWGWFRHSSASDKQA